MTVINRFYRSLLLSLVAVQGAQAAPTMASFSSVNVTIKQQLGDLRVSSSDKASPLLGSKTPVIK